MSYGRLEPGQVVAGRFRIDRVIGEGGMGTIYRARHVKLPRSFALKLLKPEMAEDADFVARFLREAVAASQVIHPNVVYVTDFGQLDDGTYFIAMEYLEGTGLDEVLERETRFSVERALDILIQLADALEYCHQRGIVHRDLKTENILLCTIHGRKDVVKLVDFGIARMIGPELTQWQITQGGMIFGTPEYLSPERALDADVDGRSDIYALGIIAFELVTGSPPFTGKYTQLLKMHIAADPPPPSTRLTTPLPPAFDGLVLRCLEKKPEDRYQTCAELVTELVRIRGSLAGGVLPTTPDAEPTSKQRPVTDGAWSTLAVRQSSLSSLPTTAAQPGETDLAALGEAVNLATEAEAVRRALRNMLKELAFGLGEGGAIGAMLPQQLEQILGLERQRQSCAEELALLSDQREQLRALNDEYAAAIRQLRLDLESVALRDDPGSPAYRPQLAALARHTDGLAEGRDRRQAALADELRDKRAALADYDTQLSQLYLALYGGLMALRGTDAARAQEQRYYRVEELHTRLSGLWGQVK